MTCKNWESIINNCKGDMGKIYEDDAGRECVFVGVVHSYDSYFYLMYYDEYDHHSYLDCACDLSGHGYTLKSSTKTIKGMD